MREEGVVRCPGSGGQQMLDWYPDEEYPGAVVCINCSYGVLVRKGSTHKAVSGTGREGLAGTVRLHFVRYERDQWKHVEPAAMAYTRRGAER